MNLNCFCNTVATRLIAIKQTCQHKFKDYRYKSILLHDLHWSEHCYHYCNHLCKFCTFNANSKKQLHISLVCKNSITLLFSAVVFMLKHIKCRASSYICSYIIINYVTQSDKTSLIAV